MALADTVARTVPSGDRLASAALACDVNCSTHGCERHTIHISKECWHAAGWDVAILTSQKWLSEAKLSSPRPGGGPTRHCPERKDAQAAKNIRGMPDHARDDLSLDSSPAQQPPGSSTPLPRCMHGPAGCSSPSDAAFLTRTQKQIQNSESKSMQRQRYQSKKSLLKLIHFLVASTSD